MPEQGFLDGKAVSRGNNYASLFIKHGCFLRIGGGRVSMFLHLYFKCWQMRGRLLNSWMAIKSYILIELDGVREKSFLGVLVFGHLYFPSINSTEFNVEHKNTCPFLCHIGSSINNISGQVITCNCAKKNCLIIFCIKFTIYKKNSNFSKELLQKYFFHLSSLWYPNRETSWKRFSPKKKNCNIFPYRNFCL